MVLFMTEGKTGHEMEGQFVLASAVLYFTVLVRTELNMKVKYPIQFQSSPMAMNSE